MEPIWAAQVLGYFGQICPTEKKSPAQAAMAALMSDRPARAISARAFVQDRSGLIPAEGFDDDFVSIDADSMGLSDVGDPEEDDEEEYNNRNRPPIFKQGGGKSRSKREILKEQLQIHGVALIESAQAECLDLRSKLERSQEQYVELRAASVSTKDTEQVVQLLAEWIAPPRPVRLNDESLGKLAEMSRKQSMRVKKILSLGAGRLRSGALQNLDKPPGIKAAEETSKKASADYKRLLQDLLERLDEENQVSLRLKNQLQEATALNSSMGSMPVTVRNDEIVPVRGAEAERGGGDDGPRSRPSAAKLQGPGDINQRRGVTKDGRLK